ncbi:beta-propeller fold lactonase family protein [Nocardioides alcanivorans]|uniref:beta-propeller fold lactonase family protein n=1 Tax=Nocardioides alcanivorans TaxID=2897352 RepID=UPI0024B04844|nr:beta-propeller fold lactonase family protein [Nocardioides alcanivorans]
MPHSSQMARVRRPAAALASLALLATGAAFVGAATNAATAAESDTTARTELAFTTTTKASIAGQYQIAVSDDTGDLFLTSAQGRPPVTVATLARVNPETLEVEATATLPKLKHGTDGIQTKWLSTHGIYVDDAHDNVWVTNTRDNQVSVFDRDSLEYVAGTYDFDLADEGTISQVAINHPREVIVDEERNLAYVTAANRGGASESSITVYSTDVAAGDVIEPIREIAIPAREDYPVAGDSAYAVTMGLEIDEATGRIYSNDFRADQYYVVDPANDFSVEAHPIPNATVVSDGVGALQPSSVAVDPSAGELYTVNQTQGTNPDSLNVFDLGTNELKYSVETGPRALAVDVDRQRGLVYVADFSNGSVTVVDVRNGGEVIETIQPDGITKSANHLTVAGGSAYMVDKAGATTGNVDYAVNLDSGETETREVAIDSITKITPAAEVRVASDAVVGGKIALEGEGWFTKDGTAGSTLGVKIDDGGFSRVTDIIEIPGRGPDATTWATIDADADGTFSVDLQLPDGTTSGANGSDPAFNAGDHTFRFLTGSLATGDTGRSIQLPFSVDASPVTPVAQQIKSKKKPVIKGKTKVGRKLKVTKGTWNTSVKVQYQWLRNGKAIKGATKATYKATKKDKAKKLKVKVTATKAGWKSKSITTKAVKIKKK